LITSKALGYSGQEGPGSGINAIGGGYGGIGGRSYEGSDYGRPYGDSNNPQEFGSAGGDIVLLSGAPKLAGNGGGKHQMSIINNLTVDGGIDSNGGDGKSSKPTTSAGSGGSINITTGYLLGSGIIESNGGTAYSGVGAGGGGRIKIVGDRIGFNGTLEAKGGISDVYNGSDGSVE